MSRVIDLYRFVTGDVIPVWGDIGDVTFASSSTINCTEGWKMYGFIFNAAQTKLWSIDNGTDTIYQYSLSTAGDPTTLSYDSVSLSVTSQVSDPTGIAINPDDDRLYIGGNGKIQEYDLSSPNDLSTASTGNSFSIVGSWKILGLHRNIDGSKFWGPTDAAGAGGSDTAHEWVLSTEFDITSSSLDASNVYNSGGQLYDFLVYPDGTHVLALNQTSAPGGAGVYQYELLTDYDIEDPDAVNPLSPTFSDAVSSFDFSTKETVLGCVLPNHDGSAVYISGNGSKKLHKYNW